VQRAAKEKPADTAYGGATLLPASETTRKEPEFEPTEKQRDGPQCRRRVCKTEDDWWEERRKRNSEVALTRCVAPTTGRHAPRKAGHPVRPRPLDSNRDCSGILDRPLSRTMTAEFSIFQTAHIRRHSFAILAAAFRASFT